MSILATHRRRVASYAAAACAASAVLAAPPAARAQRGTPRDTTLKLEIYGFGQGDLGFDFKRNDPNWFDVNRPTKLPSTPTDFGEDGHAYVSARQSRFGVKAVLPTKRGDVTARFEIDMFGVGVDAGQTTNRLRLAYGQWGQFGGGRLWSPFMDIDVFPNILDYWGPSGMVFFRNDLLFWEPINSKTSNFQVALERPGASADAGNFADRIELQHVTPRFPLPDLSAGYRYGGDWGHVKLSGILRDIRWDQVPADTIDLSGHVTAWGAAIGSAINFLGKDVIRLQLVYGHGIQNYFNDAPVDVGAKLNLSNLRTPLTGEALPIFGAVAYLDHNWTDRVTTSLGWSMVNIDNSDAQASNAFHNGQYSTVNLLWTPVTNVMMGAEFQYGGRWNNGNDFQFNDYRLQISFKYSFSQKFGGPQ